MKDTDRLLIGTSWVRSKGKHFNTVGTIDSIGSRGPRLKVEDGHTNSTYMRIVWAELGNQWQPKNNDAQQAYDRWAQKLALEIAAEVNAKESETVVPQQHSPAVESGNGVVTMETPEVAVKECHGAWHRHGEKYDLIPLSEFSIATRGINKGQLGAVCDSCKEKGLLAPSKKSKKLVIAPTPIVLEPKVETPEGTYYRWRVVVIQPTEHIVQARDFLDAAAQVAGLGEITRVEKI